MVVRHEINISAMRVIIKSGSENTHARPASSHLVCKLADKLNLVVSQSHDY